MKTESLEIKPYSFQGKQFWDVYRVDGKYRSLLMSASKERWLEVCALVQHHLESVENAQQ